MELELTGRVALVTGGSAGLGRATATTLAAEGARVAIVARGTDRLEEAADDIRTRTPTAEVVTIAADVSDPTHAQRIVGSVVDAFGGLDILVNNAGTSRAMPFLDADGDAWQDDLELKVLGAVRLCRLAVPLMRQRGGGSIVNILATSAKAPPAASVPTSVSRAAGMALTKALSKEYAPDRILVNAVLIGFAKSAQWESMWQQAGAASLDDFYQQLGAGVPVGRVGEAEELADLVAFLVSERARFITGTAINFDGGASPVV
jgi:NAD(P)-dependent dehydrogenase (short-subunit alcohol dehydrogenase family)